MGGSLALCLEMPTAKLHPEVAQGNAGLKLGLTEGRWSDSPPRSTGTHQAELLSFPIGTRRRKGPAEILEVEDKGGGNREGQTHSKENLQHTVGKKKGFIITIINVFISLTLNCKSLNHYILSE